jgi:hypothetical protein
MKNFNKGLYSYNPYTIKSFKVNGIECYILTPVASCLPSEDTCVEIERQLTMAEHKEAKEVISCLMKK